MRRLLTPKQPNTPKQPTVWDHPDTQRSLDTLMEAFRTDDDLMRKGAVACFTDTLLPIVQTEVLDRLLTAARSKPKTSGRRSVRALREIGTEAIMHLALRLAGSRDRRTRLRLVELLPEISSSHHGFAIAALLRVLKGRQENAALREAARRALLRVWPEYPQFEGASPAPRTGTEDLNARRTVTSDRNRPSEGPGDCELPW